MTLYMLQFSYAPRVVGSPDEESRIGGWLCFVNTTKS